MNKYNLGDIAYLKPKSDRVSIVQFKEEGKIIVRLDKETIIEVNDYELETESEHAERFSNLKQNSGNWQIG